MIVQEIETETDAALKLSNQAGKAYLPLLAAQEGLWVAQKLDVTNPRYNCGGYLDIQGSMDLECLNKATYLTICETEALRAKFIEARDGIWQEIHTVTAVPISIVDLTQEVEPVALAETLMQTDLGTSVSLEKDALFNHILIKISGERSFFYFRYHHILMDGFGQIIYWRRLTEIYNSLVAGNKYKIKKTNPMKQLLSEETEYRSSTKFEEDRQFWLEKFADQQSSAHLNEHQSMPSHSLLRRITSLSPKNIKNLMQCAAKIQTRWSDVIIAAVAAYMYRVTGINNIVLTLPVSNRLTQLALSTPSMAVNDLPLCLNVESTMSIFTLVKQVSSELGMLLKHQRYRGEALRQALKFSGNTQKLTWPSVNIILFDKSINFSGTTTTAHHLSSGAVTDILIGFHGDMDKSDLKIYFDANPNLYTEDELCKHQQRFQHFFESFIKSNIDATIKEQDFLLPKEIAAIAKFNATERDYDLSKCIHQLIDDQARRTPEAIAVATATASLTYQQLVKKANNIAAILQEKGVLSGDRVGIYDVRSLELVINLVAILKAGAAYVPLDPELPARRIAYQLEDAGIKIVLTRLTWLNHLNDFNIEALPTDNLLTTLVNFPPLLPVSFSPENPMYVIYTSGSTGQPKGVVVSHKGVVNRLTWMQEAFAISSEDCILQKTPFTFDVSVWEFFWPLIIGSRLFLAEPGGHRDPRYIAKAIRDYSITVLHFVPPMLDLFLEEVENNADFRGLKKIICSGEALRQKTVGKFFSLFDYGRERIELYNLYGPTEASIDITYWKCSPEDVDRPIPIGYPVANTQLYIFNPSGELAPIGMAGELYVAGVQIAIGYINNMALTCERFITSSIEKQRMYKTGDLVRYRKDGAIEFLGRIDDQIKIRGFRVELGEIESVLLMHSGVEQAIITVSEDKSNARIIAYVVLKGKTQLTTQDLSEYLGTLLPEYMIPAYIYILDKLPFLLNGKIDRAALSMPETTTLDTNREPANEEEVLLYKVWTNLFGFNNFKVDDSFFSLGGDSMSIIRMRMELEKLGYTINIQDIFDYPSVHMMAKHLQKHEGDSSDKQLFQPFSMLSESERILLPEDVEDAYPLSAMQGGMLFQTEYDLESSVYRVVTSLHIAAEFDMVNLRKAITDTCQRHPILRTSFDLSHYSQPLQLVHRKAKVQFEQGANLCDLDVQTQQQVIDDWLQEAMLHRFDLTAPPLAVFVVHQRGECSFQLTAVEHHIILDGWSDIAMIEEVLTRYRALLSGEELWLAEVPVTYSEFIAEEQRIIANRATQQFWKDYLQGVTPTPLPRRVADASCHSSDKVRHRAFNVSLPDSIEQPLRQLAKSEALPLKVLLITAHILVLSILSDTPEIVTGIVFNGRSEKPGGDEVMGVFLNTLPLRIAMNGQSLLSIAHAIFNFERDTVSHGRYPFSQMQQDLNSQLQLDSYVNFMDFHQHWHEQEDGGVKVLDAIGIANTNFLLAANYLFDPIQGKLRLWLDCDISSLDQTFCERLTGYYQRALETIAFNPLINAGKVNLLDQHELACIEKWNNTSIAYNRNDTIHAMIERQALNRGDFIALCHGWNDMGYSEFNEKTNQLAHYLHKIGVCKGNLVGIYLKRSLDLVVSIVAVLKAGGAYVPLDPDYPLTRLAFIVDDANIKFLVTHNMVSQKVNVKNIVNLDTDSEEIKKQPITSVNSLVSGSDPAYVIYTSGSSGLPKGTIVRHCNVINFFMGMNERIGCKKDDVVLAVTSISFDISVLELLWPLTQGSKVIVAGEKLINNLVKDKYVPDTTLGFSLFFFGAATGNDERAEGYQLVLDAARYADEHGFEAVWTPERHFHEFGGLYPNPSVLTAGLATITQQVKLRCGSIVAPLHDPIRIAEDWALLDNLSHGRVGLAFASGWNANDFTLNPQNYINRKAYMITQFDEFLTLWHGGVVSRTNGVGEQVSVRIFPSPVQHEPPIWFTSAGAIETFEMAGAKGVNILTHLLGQDLDQLAEKIKAYRGARRLHGYPGPGHVTVMIHTFLLEDESAAKELAKGPFREYLRTSTGLLDALVTSMGLNLPKTMTSEDLESILDLAVERYFEHSGLFGSPASAETILQQIIDIGANEVACLIDFGVPPEKVIEGLHSLNELKQQHEHEVAENEHSFIELCRRHQITLLQGTPSLLAAIASESQALNALTHVRAILVGGEQFPIGLGERLFSELPHTRIFNMYGPTETTIWSTVHELDMVACKRTSLVPIGQPIANTEILIFDNNQRQVPIGVAGELWIAGDGVTGQYLNRPVLTMKSFLKHPDEEKIIYRTGDRARWRSDGLLEFLGRVDRQIKILGHRIELDEIENVLSQYSQVASVAVVASMQSESTVELVAYVSPERVDTNSVAEDAHLQSWSEIWNHAYESIQTTTNKDDFSGWLSSYTDKPIAEEEMLEWLSHTIDKINWLQPSTVIELGMGVGLILKNIVPNVQRYLGIDIAEQALVKASQLFQKDKKNSDKINLIHGDANYLKNLDSGMADTVILNSVIQYFPNLNYLDNVIDNAVRIVGKAGSVFIGDVRDIDLLEAFHSSVRTHRASALTTVSELLVNINRHILAEKELCVSKKYFHKLISKYNDISEVIIEVKGGRNVNELTCFRYDVTLIGKDRKDSDELKKIINWQNISDINEISTVLRKLKVGEQIKVIEIPNKRLTKPLALMKLLKDVPETMTAWELERHLWEIDDARAISPHVIDELAKNLNCKSRIFIPPNGDLSQFDVVFKREDDDNV